jgi:hypothetical protein
VRAYILQEFMQISLKADLRPPTRLSGGEACESSPSVKVGGSHGRAAPASASLAWLALVRSLLSGAWARCFLLNVDFSADLSSPSLHSLFSLNFGISHTLMPRQHSSWIPQCAANAPFRSQSQAG